MSVRSKGVADNFIRGAEVWRHKTTMLIAGVFWVILFSVLAGIFAGGVTFKTIATPQERAVWSYNRVASIEVVLGFGNTRMLSRMIDIPGVERVKLMPDQILELTDRYFKEKVSPKSKVATLVGLISAALVGFLIVRFYYGYGLEKGKDVFRRGAQLVDTKELTKHVKQSREGAGQYKFAGVPIPKGMEMRNIMATGGMGSGKSVAILNLADQVTAAGKKAIIYDKTGEFTSLYYRPGKDVILNPFDQRYPGWNIFKEIEEVYGFEQMAFSLLPDPKDADANAKYFAAGGRSLFAAVLRKLFEEGRRSTKDLVNTLLTKSPADLAKFVEGTKAAAYVSPKAAEQAGGVVSTLTGAIWYLEHVPDGDFSIKEWVRREDDSRLFITSHETVHDVILPLVSVYIDIAIRTSMTLPQSREDRLWIFLDELGSLKHLPILKTSLTEARKYGVVHVVGLQNVAQLREVFGQDVTQTIRSNLQNYLILRVADEDTQEAYSKLIGSQEQDEQAEGLSFGAAASRDGATVNTQRKELRLVMPSEIKGLNDCEGYLQLAGSLPVAKVSYVPKVRQTAGVGFLPRPELRLDHSMPIKATASEDDAPTHLHETPPTASDIPPAEETPETEEDQIFTLRV